MKIFTKESLIAELTEICNGGWVQSCRKPGNDGAVGNTLEQLLGITENNLPLPNAAEWELKGQRRHTSTRVSSLLTLFHMDPSPRALRLIPRVLLPLYGWHLKDHPNEWSFRQTISTLAPSDRGFQVIVDDIERKVVISFNASMVGENQRDWLGTVEERIGLEELNPKPYWGFDDLEHKAGTKLKNTFYVLADAKTQGGTEYFKYNGIIMLQRFDFEKFLEALRKGIVKVDFDARSGHERGGHNHGTKFRLPPNLFPSLYDDVTIILDEPLNRKENLKRIDITAVRSIEEIENAARDGPPVVQLPDFKYEQAKGGQRKVAEQLELDLEE
jgi:MvaI/BcnI restriction endonuclease family